MPPGALFRMYDECSGLSAMVRMLPDDGRGAGPVALATVSGLAVTSVPDDPPSTVWDAVQAVGEMVLSCMPCGCAPAARRGGRRGRRWPWYRLVCDECPQTEHICRHIRNVLETVPGLRGEVHDKCCRTSAWPTRKLTGMTPDVDLGSRCAICLEGVGGASAVRCHGCRGQFHQGCMQALMDTNTRMRCPLCRAMWPLDIHWTPLWALGDGEEDDGYASEEAEVEGVQMSEVLDRGT